MTLTANRSLPTHQHNPPHHMPPTPVTRMLTTVIGSKTKAIPFPSIRQSITQPIKWTVLSCEVPRQSLVIPALMNIQYCFPLNDSNQGRSDRLDVTSPSAFLARHAIVMSVQPAGSLGPGLHQNTPPPPLSDHRTRTASNRFTTFILQVRDMTAFVIHCSIIAHIEITIHFLYRDLPYWDYNTYTFSVLFNYFIYKASRWSFLFC